MAARTDKKMLLTTPGRTRSTSLVRIATTCLLEAPQVPKKVQRAGKQQLRTYEPLRGTIPGPPTLRARSNKGTQTGPDARTTAPIAVGSARGEKAEQARPAAETC